MRRAALATLGALGAMLLPAAALADEDGGGRSVFAVGAGNRALAMGGAYVSISDEASAPAWNPGGLGFVQRMELQGSHASLGLIDLDEEFASFVLPSWRWGAGALTLRRFAVEGIEPRDDRNAVLGPDITDQESELSLAYGHAIGDAWSVGGTLKLRRHALAGFSASAVGLDLGVIARPGLALGKEGEWASRLQAGLAVRNAVEPKIRLDREEVSDPATVQVGVSYRHDLPHSIRVLGALDVEKSSASSWSPLMGLEVGVLEYLDLRTGWNPDRWSAGAGVEWRGVSVDYVYEDNALEPLHRVGISLSFGMTVEESRQAAVRAEEEAFRARLAESFQRRQDDRIEELLRSASSLREVDLEDDALEILAAVLALEPGHEGARTLQLEILKGKAAKLEASGDFASASILFGRALVLAPDDPDATAGLDRCRAESARRAARSERIRTLFDEALDAFSAGNLRTAQDRLRAILEVEPNDAEAKTLLARTRVAIDARTRALLEQARRVLAAGLPGEAESLVDEARKLDANAPGLDELVARIRAAERAKSPAASPSKATLLATPTPAPAAIAPKSAAVSKKKQKDLADLYRRGMDAMQEGRTDDALRYWELVWLGDSEYPGVAEHLKREYLLRGLESFSRGSLEEAILLWEKALGVDPKDQKTIGYLARAREQMNRSREILGSKP
jgi:tetratricopeptide (TPR) repeat protein